MTTTASDNLLAAAVIAVAALTVAVWCGAALAVAITERELLHATAVSSTAARRRRLLAVHDLVSGCIQVVRRVWLWLRFSAPKVGLERRERLGVDPRSRMATLRDVAPLIVREQTRGRFALPSR
ncbi:MAG: hypothetical protein ABI658_31385 [Acidimicrobiales bacterium]